MCGATPWREPATITISTRRTARRSEHCGIAILGTNVRSSSPEGQPGGRILGSSVQDRPSGAPAMRAESVRSAPHIRPPSAATSALEICRAPVDHTVTTDGCGGGATVVVVVVVDGAGGTTAGAFTAGGTVVVSLV